MGWVQGVARFVDPVVRTVAGLVGGTAAGPDDAASIRELRERLARLRLLTETAAAMSSAATPLQVADVAVTGFGRLLGTTSVAVFELRGHDSLDAMTLGGWVQGARDAWTTMPIDAPAPVADAARTRTPVWTESAAAWHSTYPHLVGMLDTYGYTGVLGLPLVAADELIGAVGIGFVGDRTLDTDERTVVLSLADQCAQALHRARALQVESAARRTAEQLTAMVAALSRSRTPRQVAAAIGAAAASLGASTSVVAVRSADDRLRLLATTDDAPAPAELPLSAAHPLAYAVRTGEPVWLARRSELAWRDRSFTTSPQTPDVDVAVPMFLDDATVGAIGMAFADDAPPHYSREERQAILTLAAQSAQALDRARLQQTEHDIAQTLQRSLLPDRLPELDRLGFAAHYLPGAEHAQAGGDWYEVLELDPPYVALVVGDVVGKGPAAAALMGQLRTALAAALLRGDGPAAALRQLDRFAGRVPGARASTAACVLLESETGAACWASAGHPPPLLVSGSGGRFLPGATGPALGLPGTRGRRYTEREVRLAPGDTLVLYTDGLVERRGEPLDEGLARLRAAAERRADDPPEVMAATLLRDLFDDTGPPDDVAVILTRLLPAPLRLLLPAHATELRAMRRTVDGWTAAAGLGVEQAEDVQFALGEAVANSIEHAYRDRDAGEVSVALDRRADGSVLARVVDRGVWHPPPDDPGYRGRGLAVIRGVSEDVEIVPGTGGTHVGFRVPPAVPDPVDPPPRRSPGGRSVDATLSVTSTGDTVLVEIRGEVDLVGAAALRDRLTAAVAAAPAGGRVVLDLDETDYLASAGVALLLDAVEYARRRDVAVEARLTSGGAVARILELTGVDTLLGTGGAGNR